MQTTNNKTLTVDNRDMLLMIHISLKMYVHIPSHSTRANILSCYLKYILTVEQVLFKLLYLTNNSQIDLMLNLPTKKFHLVVCNYIENMVNAIQHKRKL